MEDPRDGRRKPNGKKCPGWHLNVSVGDRSAVSKGHTAPVCWELGLKFRVLYCKTQRQAEGVYVCVYGGGREILGLA